MNPFKTLNDCQFVYRTELRTQAFFMRPTPHIMSIHSKDLDHSLYAHLPKFEVVTEKTIDEFLTRVE